jgi:hypothetical protein
LFWVAIGYNFGRVALDVGRCEEVRTCLEPRCHRYALALVGGIYNWGRYSPSRKYRRGPTIMSSYLCPKSEKSLSISEAVGLRLALRWHLSALGTTRQTYNFDHQGVFGVLHVC